MQPPPPRSRPPCAAKATSSWCPKARRCAAPAGGRDPRCSRCRPACRPPPPSRPSLKRLVRITPPVAGRLVRLHHQLGDAVKAGDALITMDSSEISSVRAEHAKSQAALLHARREFDRQKLLFDAEIAARKDYEAAQRSLAAAGADARAASDHLSRLGAAVQEGSRGSYVVKSPISGRVVEMAGSRGATGNDVNASVMTVADLRRSPKRQRQRARPGPKCGRWASRPIALAAYPDLRAAGPRAVRGRAGGHRHARLKIVTQVPGLAAEGDEQQITIPLERALLATPGMHVLRSRSLFALSLITVVFEDGVDGYWARQRLSASTRSRCPMAPAPGWTYSSPTGGSTANAESPCAACASCPSCSNGW
ncbi:Coiled-coil domain-containing protein 40 [Manis javanica]|nr:Coiled-coil domain-containing protein 40 [Manis javanica]